MRKTQSIFCEDQSIQDSLFPITPPSTNIKRVLRYERRREPGLCFGSSAISSGGAIASAVRAAVMEDFLSLLRPCTNVAPRATNDSNANPANGLVRFMSISVSRLDLPSLDTLGCKCSPLSLQMNSWRSGHRWHRWDRSSSIDFPRDSGPAWSSWVKVSISDGLLSRTH